MLRPVFLAGILVLASLSLAHGQTPKPGDSKAKKTPFDKVEGYKVHQLAGFTVIVSDDVFSADTSGMKRKPVECIELELKNVAGLMNAKSADALRKVPIWAEWNERHGMANGRGGVAYASYYSGQFTLLGRGMNPLKSKCVVLHLTKELAESYQEKDRPETLVMLHELAHAVHDQLLGNDNPTVRAAFQQAMSRKLYDKSDYIATNEHEFFAEASCAYLDRLDYFPKTRDDLKSHDPQTYKVLDAIWGKSAAPQDANRSKRPDDGSKEYGLDAKLDDVEWGRLLAGEAFRMAEAKGRVVLLAYAAPEQGAFLKRLSAWHEEFGPYGLSIALVNADYRNADAPSEFKQMKLPFPIYAKTYLPSKQGTAAESAGHAALFDTAGKCLFRGQIDDATIFVKEAIGQRIYSSLHIPEEAPPKPLQPALNALLAGEPLTGVAVKAQPFASASDATVAETAKALIAAIAEPGTKLLADAVAMKKSEPVEAFIIAEKLAARFKGISVGKKASALALDLQGTQAVQAELKARKDLETVTKLEAHLSSQPGSFSPRSDRFQARNAVALKQLKDAVEVMKKKYPGAKATQQALNIAKEYGVE